MQAETLAFAYRLWRRNWKGRGKEYTAGALVWQVSVQAAFTPATPLHTPHENPSWPHFACGRSETARRR